MKKCCQSK